MKLTEAGFPSSGTQAQCVQGFRLAKIVESISNPKRIAEIIRVEINSISFRKRHVDFTVMAALLSRHQGDHRPDQGSTLESHKCSRMR